MFGWVEAIAPTVLTWQVPEHGMANSPCVLSRSVEPRRAPENVAGSALLGMAHVQGVGGLATRCALTKNRGGAPPPRGGSICSLFMGHQISSLVVFRIHRRIGRAVLRYRRNGQNAGPNARLTAGWWSDPWRRPAVCSTFSSRHGPELTLHRVADLALDEQVRVEVRLPGANLSAFGTRRSRGTRRSPPPHRIATGASVRRDCGEPPFDGCVISVIPDR